MFAFKKAIKTLILDYCLNIFFSNFSRVFSEINEMLYELLNTNLMYITIIIGNANSNNLEIHYHYIHISYPKFTLVNKNKELSIIGNIAISLYEPNSKYIRYTSNGVTSFNIPVKYIESINISECALSNNIMACTMTLIDNNNIPINFNNYQLSIDIEDD